MADLPDRTKRFALDVFDLCDTLPKRPKYQIVGRQLMRSASSVAANYRAARRAQSRRAFMAKLAIVEEEADESLFWLEMLEALGGGNRDALAHLTDEADQLVAIIVASRKTCRQGMTSANART